VETEARLAEVGAVPVTSNIERSTTNGEGKRGGRRAAN
jgi:hypothetical protein